MRIVHDIECLPNFFSIAIVDYDSDREWSFEISERRNDIDRIVEFYNDVKIAIGFNSVHYDDIVINYLFKNYKKLKSLSYLEVTKQLKIISDYVVNDRYEDYKQYKYNIRYTQLDLYLYWSKMLRLSKKLSLKSIAVGMNWKLIKEFPLKHTDNIKLEQIDEFLKYNFNDSYVTKELANRLSKDINLRMEAKKLYGLDCLNWDGVKLGLNVLLKRYCDRTGLELSDVKDLRTTHYSFVLNDIILPEIEFKYEENQDYWIDKDTYCCKNFYTLLKLMKQRTVTTTTELSYRVYYKDTVYDIKSGGLHSFHKSEIIEPSITELYLDKDVSSYYPTLGAMWNFVPKHLGYQFAEELDAIRKERLELKANGLGKSNQANLLKLGMNGGFYGNTNNEYTPMFDTECMLKITLNGQLFLLMLCEWCEDIGVSVDMCNTDGVTILCSKDNLVRLDEICKKWEILTKCELETVEYLKVVRMNINNYLAISREEGKIKVKEKGLFVTKPELGNSNDELIIPKALQAYYKDGIRPEEFIRNHNNIFDFCSAFKIDKKFKVIWNNQIQQQLNRFYVSKKGCYLYKQKDSKQVLENVLKGHGVILYNEHIEKPINEYNIDYQYYINKVNKIINELSPKQTLF
jgi:hypothetical protein